MVRALARAAGLQHREQSPEHARIDALPLSPQRPPDEPRDVGSCCRRLHNGGSRQRQQPRPVEEAEELLGRVCLDILCAPTIPSTPSLIPSSKWKVPSRRTFVSRQSASASAASCSVQRRRKRLPSTTPSKMCVTNSPPDCNSARDKIPESYLHLGVGARRRHEIAAAYRVPGARHLVDVRRGPRPNEDLPYRCLPRSSLTASPGLSPAG